MSVMPLIAALVAGLVSLPPLTPVADRVESYLQPYAREGLLSGTVLVAKGDKVLFEKSYGFADLENGVPNRNQSRYCVASVTKWMTLAIVLQMIYSRQID